MAFSSMAFLFGFLPAAVLCYYLIPARYRAGRNGVLLLFSLAFYAWGGLWLLPVLLANCLVSWAAGLLLAPGRRGRRAVFWTGVGLNLLPLLCFKYTGFLAENLNALGLKLKIPGLLLPAGISFFTFQGLSYVIDVYRDESQVSRSFVKLMLYVAFFPQLIAGPIVKYHDVSRQIDERHTSPALTADSSTFLFSTGRVPGIPVHTGQHWVLGPPPKAVVQEQKIFVLVASSTWVSRPMTVSQVMPVRLLPGCAYDSPCPAGRRGRRSKARPRRSAAR